MSTDSSKPRHRPVVTASEAAQMKGVSRQAAHQAAQRGTLNSYHSGATRLVYVDKKLKAWLGRDPNEVLRSDD